MAGARIALAEEVAACKLEALDDGGLSDSHRAGLQAALEAAVATAGDALKRGQQALISAQTHLRHANACVRCILACPALILIAAAPYCIPFLP